MSLNSEIPVDLPWVGHTCGTHRCIIRKVRRYISVSEDHLPVYCILISLKLWVLRRIDGGHRAVCGVGRVVVHRRLLMKRVIGEGPVVHTVRHPSQTPTPGVVCREVIFELQGSKQKIKWTTVSPPKNK